MVGPRMKPVQPRRRHRLLLLVPFLWQVGCVPLVNEVALRPFGLPFPMVWQMAGVLIATLCIAVVRRLDIRAEAGQGAP
jgi:hypothetical protein